SLQLTLAKTVCTLRVESLGNISLIILLSKKSSGWRGIMGEMFVVLFWSGPIGIGFFLMGLGVLFWGIGQMKDKK
ncbi:MAG TPA: hypothetical protein VN374_00160, partial [Desulfitobacteriaceae bacterium]|nr:hypothetical protein [Desulfitobacteriaceae bacterium]